MTSTFHRTFGLLATTVVVAALVWGFFLVGSPGLRRTERLDERRLEDLQGIVWELRDLVYDHQNRDHPRRPLPASLDELVARARSTRPSILDPETGAPYEYRVTGPLTYELCATFTGARAKDERPFWNHAPGRVCFALDVRETR